MAFVSQVTKLPPPPRNTTEGLKFALEGLIQAFLLFIGLFLKNSCWVPLCQVKIGQVLLRVLMDQDEVKVSKNTRKNKPISSTPILDRTSLVRSP